MNQITWATKADYLRAKELDPRYYDDVSDRWTNYYEPAISLCKATMANRTNQTLLEVGAHLCPLARNSVRMSRDRVNLGDFVQHDALAIPWPFLDNQFGMVMALHVLEHLKGHEAEVLTEMARISRLVVFAVPYEWLKSITPNHVGITAETIDEWLRSTPLKWTDARIDGRPDYRQILVVCRRMSPVELRALGKR